MVLPLISVNCISQGAFSRVYTARIHATHCAKSKVVIKEFTENTADTSHFLKIEMQTMEAVSKIHHQHIVQGLGGFTIGNRRCFLLVWADGRNLVEFWIAYPSPILEADLWEAIILFRGFADALAGLHTLNCGHGGLKSENILRFTGATSMLGTFKISDFGIDRIHRIDTQLRRAPATSRYSTSPYEPPEAPSCDRPRPRSGDFVRWGVPSCSF